MTERERAEYLSAYVDIINCSVASPAQDLREELLAEAEKESRSQAQGEEA